MPNILKLRVVMYTQFLLIFLFTSSSVYAYSCPELTQALKKDRSPVAQAAVLLVEYFTQTADPKKLSEANACIMAREMAPKLDFLMGVMGLNKDLATTTEAIYDKLFSQAYYNELAKAIANNMMIGRDFKTALGTLWSVVQAGKKRDYNLLFFQLTVQGGITVYYGSATYKSMLKTTKYCGKVAWYGAFSVYKSDKYGVCK